jgi:putative inorganic carbon (hco3(-)) transporter
MAVLLPLVFGLLRGLAYGRLTRRSPADIPIGILVMMLPVTYWATALPAVTIPQIFRLLGGIGLYFAIVNWATGEDRLRWLVRGTAAGGFSLAIFSLVSVHWFTNKLPFIPASLYRQFRLLVSDAIHPNVMAGSLVILLPVALAVMLFAWKSMKWPERIFFCATVACMCAVLMLTVSRGAWLAFGVVLLLMAMLRWRWGWLGCVLAAAAGGAAIYIAGAEKILEAIASSNTLGGFNGRIEVWSRAVLMIEDFPFSGIGMGSFGPIADAMYPFLLFAPGSIPHAHNLYLQIAMDLGIPGLLAWLAIFAVIVTISIQIVTAQPHGLFSQSRASPA